jgi:hypothetical protein
MSLQAALSPVATPHRLSKRLIFVFVVHVFSFFFFSGVRSFFFGWSLNAELSRLTVHEA